MGHANAGTARLKEIWMRNNSRPTTDKVTAHAARPATLAAAGPHLVSSGPINPSVERASTILYPTVESYMKRHDGFYDDVIYGLYGTGTTFALAESVAALEGGYMSVITSSGSAAITLGMLSFLKAGDHALIVDCVYGPTRRFCELALRPLGIDVSYFDPLADEKTFQAALRPNTRVVYFESPGSQTFEVSDIARLAALAHGHNAITLMDNTWATPLLFRPLEHGIDVSIASASKYLSGHSDVMLGTLTMSSAEHYEQVKDTVGRWGNCAGPDECYLVHRGIRTLDVRLERHQRNAFELIEWLGKQPLVQRILYPALPTDPGHAIWKRDFKGASGLFGVLLADPCRTVARQFFDHFQHFKMGSSWGGFESLIVPAWPPPARQVRAAPAEGFLIRVHAGLEDPADLIADLEAGFHRLHLALGR
jgi:cystathionine beta-lyase